MIQRITTQIIDVADGAAGDAHTSDSKPFQIDCLYESYAYRVNGNEVEISYRATLSGIVVRDGVMTSIHGEADFTEYDKIPERARVHMLGPVKLHDLVMP